MDLQNKGRARCRAEMEIGEELSSGGCWAVLVCSDNVKLGFLITRWLKKALPVALSVPVPAEDFVPKQSLVNANLFFRDDLTM